MTKIQLPQQLECKRCHHKWIPRTEDVKICPNCKSAYWDTEPKKRPILKLLGKNTKIYARPDGSHFHTKRDCQMLQGRQFKEMGYVEITPEQARKRKLRPCACAYGKPGKSNRKEE